MTPQAHVRRLVRPVARYIYICSAGHSGSTLLDLLIGSHPRITSLGEISQFSKNVALNTPCSCGAPVRSCRFWSEILRQLGNELGIDLVTDPYGLHLGYPLASSVVDPARQTRRYIVARKLVLGLYFARLKLHLPVLEYFTPGVSLAVNNNVRLYEAVRRLAGSDAVVDSSKSYLKAVALYRQHPERVRIILLTRDGRAVLWSNLRRGTSRAAAIRDWRHQYTRAVPLLRRWVRPEHMMHVGYEALASETRGTLDSICRFVELPFDESMLNFRAKIHHVANGNRMRMSTSADVQPDVAWRTKLSQDDLDYFEREAGRLNRSLGYS